MGSVDILLDTCTFIWLCAEPARLSEPAGQRIDESDTILLSDVSVLEIALKWSSGKLQLPAPPRSWIPEQADVWSIEALPIQQDDIYRTTELPTIHKDPFDRLLVATALNRNIELITPDPWVHKYPANTSW
jgi:PIN domain nuclease of toxin-antitoxin system